MIMNLFIGIIASSVEDAKHKLDDEALMAEHHAHHHKATPGKNLEEMVNMLNKMAIEMQNFGSTSDGKELEWTKYIRTEYFESFEQKYDRGESNANDKQV